jgi:hypothetical protein
MTLKETLTSQSFEDIHLVHQNVDNDPATIVELHSGTLTEAGKEAWADVMNAEVISVFKGVHGLQILLRGVKASRIDDFSRMLAGYCSVEDYDTWVSSDPVPEIETKEFYLPVTWSVCGYVKVAADTFETAVNDFKEHSDMIALPSDSEYVDGSFTLSSYDIEALRAMNEAERKRQEVKP